MEEVKTRLEKLRKNRIGKPHIEEDDILKRLNEISNDLSAKEDIDQTFTGLFQNMPFPAWVKAYDREDDSFIMLGVNKAYESVFGKIDEFYNNHKDSEIWDEDTAKAFNANDKAALSSPVPILFEEKLINPRTGSEQEVVSYKWSDVAPSGIEVVYGISVSVDISGLREFTNRLNSVENLLAEEIKITRSIVEKNAEVAKDAIVRLEEIMNQILKNQDLISKD